MIYQLTVLSRSKNRPRNGSSNILCFEEKLQIEADLHAARHEMRLAQARPPPACRFPPGALGFSTPSSTLLLCLVSKARTLISGCFWIGAGLATLMVTAEASEKSEKTGGEKPAKEVSEGSNSEEEDDGVEIPCDFVEKMDHYERLGVKKGASEADIKKASDPLLFPR